MDRSFDATGLGRNHREQIERVVDELHDVLGADLLGSYLYGSAVEGGLRPRSDVDLLAISRVRATERQRQRLVSRLLAISSDSTDPGPSRPIDLAVVVGSEIRPWRYPPTVDLQYGEWLRSRFEASEREVSLPRDDPDVALRLSMV